jgi:hypothetical protein
MVVNKEKKKKITIRFYIPTEILLHKETNVKEKIKNKLHKNEDNRGWK